MFESDSSGEYLNNDFILRRLNELPAAARMILAWASLLGSTFSFGLVQKLVSGEFAGQLITDDKPRPTSRGSQSNPSNDAVGGLQTALQACILVPGDDDDQFRYV